MSTKQLMTSEELEQFFITSGINTYVNPNGVNVTYAEDVSCRVRIWDDGAASSFVLYADLPAEAFIREFGIRNASDLEAIEEQALWLQYKKGNGHVWATLFNEGPELTFQVIDGGTVIEGFQLPYRNEVAEVWNSVGQFRDFVRDNMRGIYVAAEEAVV